MTTRLFLLTSLLGVAWAAAGQEDLLQGLHREHPRLFATDSAWKELRERRRTDVALDRFLGHLETNGWALMEAPALRYQKEGRRLLAVSRTAVQHIVLFSFDYRLTGDPAFLKRAEADLLTAAAFQDWNPSHYLDTAEMTAALAVGYDWLYDALPASSRKLIREAIVEKGLRTGVDPASPHNSNWYRAEMNWNQVCFGGLTLGALAVAEDEPELSRRMLNQVKTFNFHGLKPYAPDGVYPEGAGYWGYGTMYEVVQIAALESALGTDWGLTQSPGFLASARFMAQMTGPEGLVYAFSDGHSHLASLDPTLVWMARRSQEPGLLYFQRAAFEREMSQGRGGGGPYLPLLAFWWYGLPEPPPPDLPLAWQGRGPNPVAVFRGSWTDANALFLAFKAGSASLNHGHMDAGSFVLDVDGVRWAEDLGAQDYYSLESKNINLWSNAQDSDRWKVFRLGNLSHNTLTINGQLHRAKGRAEIARFSGDAKEPWAVVDLDGVFEGQAGRVRRGFRVLPGREVLVQDELAGLKTGDEVRWAMVTTASIDLDGRRAVLRLQGKQLHAQLLEPANAAFEVVSAECLNDPINAPNPNTRILVVRAKAPDSGELRLGVRLGPGEAAGAEASTPLASLDSWR